MKVLQEGPLASFLTRFIDLILLNLLWFLCSLPIFTIGASTCALYDVTIRQALHESPTITSTFFGAFRRCFKKATVLFLIFFAAGLFLAVDLWCAFQWKTQIQFVIIVVILAAAYFYLAVLCHVFPVLTYFGTGIKETIRKAFILSMSNGVFTVFIMVMNLMPVFMILKFPLYFGQIFFFYFILGFSVIATLCSMHLIRLFDPTRVREAEELQEKIKEYEKNKI